MKKHKVITENLWQISNENMFADPIFPGVQLYSIAMMKIYSFLLQIIFMCSKHIC